jgi:hypothetical protein
LEQQHIRELCLPWFENGRKFSGLQDKAEKTQRDRLSPETPGDLPTSDGDGAQRAPAD